MVRNVDRLPGTLDLRAWFNKIDDLIQGLFGDCVKRWRLHINIVCPGVHVYVYVHVCVCVCAHTQTESIIKDEEFTLQR